MQWSDISFNPPRRTLRQFAGLWLAFFTALAAWQWLRADNPTAAALLAAIGVTAGVAGLVFPPAARPVFIAAMVLAFPIGWVVSRVLLALAYYVLFTPIALIFKLVGRDALALRARPRVATYWTPK